MYENIFDVYPPDMRSSNQLSRCIMLLKDENFKPLKKQTQISIHWFLNE